MSLNNLFGFDPRKEALITKLKEYANGDFFKEPFAIQLTDKEISVIEPSKIYRHRPHEFSLKSLIEDVFNVEFDILVGLRSLFLNIDGENIIEIEKRTTNKEAIDAIINYLISKGLYNEVNESLDTLFGHNNINRLLKIIDEKYSSDEELGFSLDRKEANIFFKNLFKIDGDDVIDLANKILEENSSEYKLSWKLSRHLNKISLEFSLFKNGSNSPVWKSWIQQRSSYKNIGIFFIELLDYCDIRKKKVNESLDTLFGFDNRIEMLEEIIRLKGTDEIIYNKSDNPGKKNAKMLKFISFDSGKFADTSTIIGAINKLLFDNRSHISWKESINGKIIIYNRVSENFEVLPTTTKKEVSDYLLNIINKFKIDESLDNIFNYDEKIEELLKIINERFSSDDKLNFEPTKDSALKFFNDLLRIDNGKSIIDLVNDIFKDNQVDKTLKTLFFDKEYRLILDNKEVWLTPTTTYKMMGDAFKNMIEKNLNKKINESSEYGDDWNPEYVVKPHKDDKIFKFVKSEYKPLDTRLQSYKNFIKQFKSYRNSDQVKKLNQNLSEQINKINQEMKLFSKEEFKKKSLNESIDNMFGEQPLQYKCEWDETYEAEPIDCGIEFFNEDNGYDEEGIAAIKALKPGESVKLDGGHHTVTALGEFSDEDSDDINEFLEPKKGGATVPVFKGLSAHNKPLKFIEYHKTPEEIANILASGKNVVITADIAKQPGVPEHKKESEFNVKAVEGNIVKVISAKYEKEYDITDTRKIEEIYITEPVLQENEDMTSTAPSTTSTSDMVKGIYDELTSLSAKIFDLHHDEILQKTKAFQKISGASQKIVDIKALFEEMMEEIKEYPAAKTEKESAVNENLDSTKIKLCFNAVKEILRDANKAEKWLDKNSDKIDLKEISSQEDANKIVKGLIKK